MTDDINYFKIPNESMKGVLQYYAVPDKAIQTVAQEGHAVASTVWNKIRCERVAGYTAFALYWPIPHMFTVASSRGLVDIPVPKKK